MDVCHSNYMLGNLPEAKGCFDESLKVATDRRACRNCGYSNRPRISPLPQGQFDSAKSHNEEAIQASRKAGEKTGELETRYTCKRFSPLRRKMPRDPERLSLQVNHESAADPALQGEIEGALADFYAGQNNKGKQTSCIASPSAASKSSVRRSTMRNSGCLFLPTAMLSIVGTPTFSSASHKPEYALQLLDVGRARTMAEGLN